MNEGKLFESDFKKSIPVRCWSYRFKDSGGSWQGGDKARFTPSNICDFMVMAKNKLYLLELKSHKGASIPFTCIRDNQLKEMSSIFFPNILPMFIFNFRDREETYAVKATRVKKYIESSDRKSIPLDWCRENGINIESKKKKTRYTYDLEIFFLGGLEND